MLWVYRRYHRLNIFGETGMTYDIPLVHISMHVDRLRLNVHVYMLVVQPIQKVDQHFTISLSVTVWLLLYACRL